MSIGYPTLKYVVHRLTSQVQTILPADLHGLPEKNKLIVLKYIFKHKQQILIYIPLS